MPDLTLPSGLVVPMVDHRRALPDDPLALPPRSPVTPNDNLPAGSVGPNVPVAGDVVSAQFGDPGGYGATHVMYPASDPPIQASAWAGWPVGWETPWLRAAGSQYTGDLDIAWACLDLNSRIVADMPWYVMRDGERQPAPSWLNNPQPEVYTHWGEFIAQVWWSVQAVGEAFIVATSRYADGWPRRFMMREPSFVAVDLVDGRRRYTVAGADVPDGDMLHIRYVSWPSDAHGHSPLEVGRFHITAAKVLNRYGTDLAASGGIPWAVLQYKGRLTEDQAKLVRRQWIEAAAQRAGAPAILDQDATLRELQVSPKDMALAEQLQRIEARVCVLLGVPPYLMGLAAQSGSMTYANATEWFRQHWRTTLRTIGRDIARPLSNWVLPAGHDIEIQPAAYIEQDAPGRAQYYEAMVRMGAMTVAEIRAAERLAPVPNGTLPTPSVRPVWSGNEQPNVVPTGA